LTAQGDKVTIMYSHILFDTDGLIE